MAAQLLPNLTIAKYDTLLPLFSNNAHKLENDLISRLNKDLFSSHNTQPRHLLPRVSTKQQHFTTCTPTPMPSPPRTPVALEPTSPQRSSMITPPPEQQAKHELMTIASKVPLFKRRKTNYINKGITTQGKGPIVMKLCKINYTPSPSPSPSPSPPPSQIPINITIPSTKQRKFRCKTCSMAFTTSGHLSRHNKIHTGERNFTCPHESCNQKFSRHDNCLQHYRTHLKKQQRNKKK